MWFAVVWALLVISCRRAQEKPTGNGDDQLDASQCKPIQSIYQNGKDLCERIYGTSFRYVPVNDSEYNLAYTMWFFTASNPNDYTTQMRVNAGLQSPNYSSTDICYLKTDGVTFHSSFPNKQNPSFTECHPFRNNACCEESTVENSTVIDDLYGPGYRWDRCGPLSHECERFFVQESCFYECDPNAGLFRKYTPAFVLANPQYINDTWEIYQLPIKGDYCDAWFDACRFDSFCGDGDFFSCSKIYAPPPSPPVLTSGIIAGIVIGSILLVMAIIVLAFLIRRERLGRPVFHRIDMDDTTPLAKPDVAPVARFRYDHDTNIATI